MSHGARLTLFAVTTLAATGFLVVAFGVGPMLPAGPWPFVGLAAFCGVLAVACSLPSLRVSAASGQRRTRTLDDTTAASDPGGVRLSHRRLRRLRADLYGFQGLLLSLQERFANAHSIKIHLAEHLMHGDSRAAVVMQTDPLLVAAYTDELDCVAILRFPAAMVEEFRLREGDRLLTVNTYGHLDAVAADLTAGPGDFCRLQNFHPIIADFVSDDAGRIDERKREIAEAEWGRVASLGREYLSVRPGVMRDGRPGFAAVPALPART